jgi:hypothetical protein
MVAPLTYYTRTLTGVTRVRAGWLRPVIQVELKCQPCSIFGLPPEGSNAHYEWRDARLDDFLQNAMHLPAIARPPA